MFTATVVSVAACHAEVVADADTGAGAGAGAPGYGATVLNDKLKN